MTRTHPTFRLGLLVLTLALVVASAAASTAAAPRSTGLHAVSTTHASPWRTWAYDWPLKPFDRQHPVRGFLNDPRIAAHSSAFHFGIDIAAPDGTPVYAVEAGEVWFDNPSAIAVVAPDRSHSFGYWHIRPAVKDGQEVRRHQLIGWIRKGWQHVHFAERRGGVYVNPLRPGGIGPYVDRTAPTVVWVRARAGALVVDAHDVPSPAVPGAWRGEPVTPALVRWRPSGTQAWHVAVDFREAMLPASRFDSIYTPQTLQNHEGVPGRFVFYLVRGAEAARIARGDLPIEVEVTDSAGNRTVVAWAAV